LARIALYELLAFLLPFVVYFAWRLLATRGARFLDDTPWFVVTLLGLVSVCAGFVLFVVLEPGAPPGATYVPPRLEDGRLVPGGFRTP
jgi:hypothetical protein